ncbi:MBL fold metallo-hydrolase [Limnohabitans sp.]|uniref:MBL fold metallo-hydrolase n=1 Tax=Limnohabitans sp. TaxID=1907725 RepID=UPI0038B9A92F
MANTFQVGDLKVSLVVESEFPVLTPNEVYPDATQEDIDKNEAWLAPRFYDRISDKLILSFQGFLIRSDGKNILVDTCVGDCKDRRRPSFDQKKWSWLDQLIAAGCEPEQVDIVVCTHFHVDHVGWNTQRVDGTWQPTFPNARYLFVKKEWDYWRSGEGAHNITRTGDYMQDSILPIVEAGLADFVDMDHRIDPDVSLKPAPGHTPGMVCVDLQSNGSQAIITGDLLHTVLQVIYPDWSTRFCADPVLSRHTRKAFLERYANTDVMILPAHFPRPTAGYIERDSHGFRYRFVDEKKS